MTIQAIRELVGTVVMNLGMVLITVFSLIPGAAAPTAPIREAAYVEPDLVSREGEALSVIVTAEDSQAAARAVEQVGGLVTSDLWLIDAIAAIIPTRQLQALAQEPDIQSIVDNKGVGTAGEPSGDGWVTQIRVRKGSYLFEGTQNQPAAYLPDGGFVSMADNGSILIVNADGSQRARVSLSGGPFKTAAVVTDENGTIFVAGEAKRVYALNPDGSTRWAFTGAREKFLAGVALGPDRTVYVADEKRNVYGLDPATGQTLWEFSADGDGSVEAAPPLDRMERSTS